MSNLFRNIQSLVVSFYKVLAKIHVTLFQVSLKIERKRTAKGSISDSHPGCEINARNSQATKGMLREKGSFDSADGTLRSAIKLAAEGSGGKKASAIV